MAESWRVTVQIGVREGTSWVGRMGNILTLDPYTGELEETGRVISGLTRALEYCKEKNEEEDNDGEQ